jgi:hypothetical protein
VRLARATMNEVGSVQQRVDLESNGLEANELLIVSISFLNY